MYLFDYRQIMLLGSLVHTSALKVSSKPPLLPPKATAVKLFLFGSTIGPLVDSLHNQCLLEYDIAPITIQNPISSSASPLLCSSWAVPPLLGIAYLILGYILPRVIELVSNVKVSENDDPTTYDKTDNIELKNKAILAVTSTAGIIKLSEFLQTHLIYYSMETLYLSRLFWKQYLVLILPIQKDLQIAPFIFVNNSLWFCLSLCSNSGIHTDASLTVTFLTGT